MPPVDAGFYMIGHLLEVGPGVDGHAISYREIEAWCALTGTRLSAWEARTLHALSASYMAEFNRATSPEAPAPYLSLETLNRNAVDAKLRAAFAALREHQAQGGDQ